MTLIDWVRARPFAVPTPPEMRLHDVQWQNEAEMNGSAISNRTPPHQQLPRIGMSWRLAGGTARDAGVGLAAVAALGGELHLAAAAAAFERDLGVVLLLLVEGDLVVALLEPLVPLVVELVEVFRGPSLDDHRRPCLLGLDERHVAGDGEVGR